MKNVWCHCCQRSCHWVDCNYGRPLETTPQAMEPQKKCLPAQDTCWSWRTSNYHVHYFSRDHFPGHTFLREACSPSARLKFIPATFSHSEGNFFKCLGFTSSVTQWDLSCWRLELWPTYLWIPICRSLLIGRCAVTVYWMAFWGIFLPLCENIQSKNCIPSVSRKPWCVILPLII